jgi:hypothetical protein
MPLCRRRTGAPAAECAGAGYRLLQSSKRWNTYRMVAAQGGASRERKKPRRCGVRNKRAPGPGTAGAPGLIPRPTVPSTTVATIG